MVNRLVSVGDDFTLPAAVKAADANLPARLQDTALNATFVPKWKATTAYLAGDKVLNPNGDVVSAKVNFTSGASYNAANWNLSDAYANKGRDTLAFYDDFSTKANGALAGVVPTFGGSPWTSSGAQQFTITGGKVVSTGTAYAGQILASQPSVVYGDISWGAGTGVVPTFTMIVTKDTDLSITNAVHAVYGINSCTVTLRSGGQGAPFDPFFTVVWSKPMVADGTTRYRVKLAIQGDTVTVFGPNGEIASATNAKVSKLAGNQVIYETQANGAGLVIPQILAVGAFTRSLTKADSGAFSTPTDTAGAGILTGEFAQAVGSKNRFGEAAVGENGNGYPAVSFGSKLIMAYLSAATSAGATSITTDKPIPNGSSVRIGVYPTQDVVTSSAASTGTGPYTTTVPALTYAHAAGDAVDATPAAFSRTDMSLNPHNGQFSLPNLAVLIAPGSKLYLGTALDTFIERDGSGPCVGFSRPSRSKVYTTATRPSASSVGPGAQIYDSTLGKPTWSNGTNWTDAAGTVV